MAQEPLPLPIFARQSRRQFIRTVAGAGMGLVLAGCSGGDGGGVSTGGTGAAGGGGGLPTGTGGGVPVTGTVDLARIGGQDLVVQSVQALNGTVGTDGSFSTRVSGTGAQLVLVAEGGAQGKALQATQLPGFLAGPLRALVIALPVDGLVDALEIGVDSTAVALLFLTIGIVTIDPLEAAQRIETLRNVPSFAAFSGFLLDKLLGLALHEIATDPQFGQLRDQCIAEYRATVDPGGDSPGAFSARLNPTDRTEKGTAFDLGNGGFRFLSVVRREVDGEGTETFPPMGPVLDEAAQSLGLKNILGGATGASWGSIFTDTTDSPGTAKDRIDLEAHSATRKVEYYGFGPGDPLHAGNVILPPGVDFGDQGADAALVASGIWYLLLPVVDLLAGQAQALSRGREFARQLIDFTGLATSGEAAVTNLRTQMETRQVGNINVAYIDLIAALLGILAAGGAGALAALSVTGPLAVAFGVAAGIFAVFGFAFAATNFALAIQSWLTLPAFVRAVEDIPTDYTLVYRFTTTEAFPHHDSGDVAVNASGQVAVSSWDQLGARQRLWTRVTTGELEIREDLPDPATGRFGHDSFRTVDLNEEGDVGWMVSWEVDSRKVRLVRAGEPPSDIPRDEGVSQHLFSVPARDGQGSTSVFYSHRGQLVFQEFRTGVGTFTLPLTDFVDDYAGPVTLRANRNGLCVGAYQSTSNQDVFFLLQLALTDGTAASYLELSRGPNLRTLVAINDRGDHAFIRGIGTGGNGDIAADLTIRRVGQPDLVIPREQQPFNAQMVRMAFNDRGDLFVLAAGGAVPEGSIFKYPADGSAVVDLTSLVGADEFGLLHHARDLSAAGPYLALVGHNGSNQMELLLFREA